MKKLIIYALLFLPMISYAQFSYDLQGHRGARGLMPENTIPGMIKALELGVRTLEMDLAITLDGEIVLSHEPWMNPAICLTPDGNEIPEENHSHRIYEMKYEEVLRYDCGSKIFPSFPMQVKFRASKPRLEDVFDVVEKYVRDNELPLPRYNIEIKSYPDQDEILHPHPEDFSEKVYAFIEGKMDWERVTIQSFDFRILKYFHKVYPKVVLSMLVEESSNPANQLEQLGFEPQIYSPYFKDLTKDNILFFHQKNIKVIPWTVNTSDEMKSLLDFGVDGIITDYPNLAPKQ